MIKINTIRQGGSDCTLACIAMVTNTTIEYVQSHFTFQSTLEGTTLEEMLLIFASMKVDYILQAFPSIFSGRLYIVTVPSLNFEARNHNIVVQFCPDTLTFVINDPNEGYPGRKYYDNNNFRCYSEVVEIIPKV